MIIEETAEAYVRSEHGDYMSRVIGYEIDSDGTVLEILTEYGGVPATTRVLYPAVVTA